MQLAKGEVFRTKRVQQFDNGLFPFTVDRNVDGVVLSHEGAAGRLVTGRTGPSVNVDVVPVVLLYRSRYVEIRGH